MQTDTDDDRFSYFRTAVHKMLEQRLRLDPYKQIGLTRRWTHGARVATLSLVYDLDDPNAIVRVAGDAGPVSVEDFTLDASPLSIVAAIESLLVGTGPACPHTGGEQVGDDINSWPGGYSVDIRCADCGAFWHREQFDDEDEDD
jgi:hypothetical protein